ncbi:MAG TPA: CGNR zinc finger domain-containing protein [Streptosporangiaceae bacterium]|jgi:predicted RNA-binding Zn ribbon-like protein
MTGQVDFNSHIGAVVTVAVELVNRLTPGEARGRAYQPPADDDLGAAVTAALRTVRPDTRAVSSAEAARFGPFARALRGVFTAIAAGDTASAARQVNALLTETGARPMLDSHGGEPWHLHFHGADDSLVTGWSAGCTTGLAVLIGSTGHGQPGVCAAPRCDRVYVDVSRNGNRRFCSASCQSRVKAAAFRARQAD